MGNKIWPLRILAKPPPFVLPQDEAAFRRRFVLAGLKLSRVGTLVGGVLALMFWLLVFFLMNEEAEGGRQLIRLMLAVVLISCSIILFCAPRFSVNNYKYVVGVPAASVCFLLGLMSGFPPDVEYQASTRLVAANVLSCWLMYGFVRLSLWFVFLTCLCSSLITVAGAVFYEDGYYLVLLLYLLVANLIGWTMSVEVERRERDIYMAKKRLVNMARTLRQAVREGEQANTVKSHVLAAIGHDLRQPLTSMALYLETLKSVPEDQSGDRAVAVGGIGTCLRVMEGSIDRIADVVSIRQSEESFTLDTVDVRWIFSRVESVFRAQARKAGIRFSVVLPDSGKLVALTNEERSWDVLSNLVSNAIKYSCVREKPWVVVRAVGLRESVRITVMDNGMGIPEEFHGRIFDEYFQVDNPVRDREKGYGLGLSIVRETLERLPGHEIRLRSDAGRGCRFDIFVARGESGALSSPLSKTGEQGKALPLDGHACLVGCYALIVEDDPLVRGALVETMQAWGMLVESATSLADALELARRTDRLFDVVISDLGLPGGADGVEVIEALREEQGLQTPAIILSGQLGSADTGRLQRAGVVTMSKPAEPEHLRSCLTAVIRSVA